MANIGLRYKEITRKEFENNYLKRGIVDKLEVVNQKWVRIRLTSGNEDGKMLWFSIASIYTFEQNLERTQLSMKIESTNFAAVVYKTEINTYYI